MDSKIISYIKERLDLILVANVDKKSTRQQLKYFSLIGGVKSMNTRSILGFIRGSHFGMFAGSSLSGQRLPTH